MILGKLVSMEGVREEGKREGKRAEGMERGSGKPEGGGRKEGKRSNDAEEREEGGKREERGKNEQIIEKKGGIKVTAYMCECECVCA